MDGYDLYTLASQIYLCIAQVLAFLLHYTLPYAISSAILPSRDHFAWHPDSQFEGYYTRIQTTDRSTIILIFSSVPNASKGTSHYVHFSLTPSANSDMKKIRIDAYPQELKYTELGAQLRDGRQAFRLDADDMATYTVDHHAQTYRLRLPVDDLGEGSSEPLHISIDITNRTPLNPSRINQTPHEDTVRLGSLLPLHWHVFSTRSDATFEIKKQNGKVLSEGTGMAHVEKNWGRGFPDSWTWMQAFSDDKSGITPSTLAVAGGNIIGMKAYMVVYRSPSLSWDFAPPWTLMLGKAGWSPFTQEIVRSTLGAVELVSSTLTRRIVIRAQGSADLADWMPLDCPLFDGHGNVTARETFGAQIAVDAYVRPLRRMHWGEAGWRKVEGRVFGEAALELGGDYRSDAMLTADRVLERERYP